MGKMVNPEFRDFIPFLKNTGFNNILALGYTVILYGYSRTMEDDVTFLEGELEIEYYASVKNFFCRSQNLLCLDLHNSSQPFRLRVEFCH
jgi:hypothetical protein